MRLRHIARSLMGRAGVPRDHAEHCLGHVLPGVRGTYDRYALASLIERILNPPADNVTPLSRIFTSGC
jgi:hypothetical protein